MNVEDWCYNIVTLGCWEVDVENLCSNLHVQNCLVRFKFGCWEAQVDIVYWDFEVQKRDWLCVVHVIWWPWRVVHCRTGKYSFSSSSAASCQDYCQVFSHPSRRFDVFTCLLLFFPIFFGDSATNNTWDSSLISIDWFWDLIFRANWDIRDVDELSWDLPIVLGPHWGKCAILVQSAHLWFS